MINDRLIFWKIVLEVCPGEGLIVGEMEFFLFIRENDLVYFIKCLKG